MYLLYGYYRNIIYPKCRKCNRSTGDFNDEISEQNMGGRTAGFRQLRTVGKRIPDDKDRLHAVRNHRKRSRRQDTFRRRAVHSRRYPRVARRERREAQSNDSAPRRLEADHSAVYVPDCDAVLFLLPGTCELHRGEILDNQRQRRVRGDNPVNAGVPHGKNDRS